MRWEQGRQGTGYSKFIFWKFDTFDCYLLKYAAENYIPPHTDPVPNHRHYRINILLWGEDTFRGETIFSTRRIKFFRPDISIHSVERVSSSRLVFSIGWARKIK